MCERTAALSYVGCKVSKYETDVMAECLKNAGYDIVDFSEKASVYVINTCTVTNTGDKKSRQLIRRAKQNNKDAIVIAAGCYSQVSPLEVSELEGVNIVIGTSGHTNIVQIIDDYCNNGHKILIEPAKNVFENAKISEQRDRVRAYVKIEDGCENFCSYCIIPYARGSVKSRAKQDILNEIRLLCNNGANEIVLTGIHVASYGKDLENTSLAALLDEICRIDELQRLRLSSLEPKTITKEFLNILAQYDSFCDYFHLSLQSGSEKILKAMNRKYTAQQYKESVSLVYDTFPNAAVWSDIIVGFPGETYDDFLECYDFIKNSGIVKMHIFPFSPKKGTKAFTMDNMVKQREKSVRLNRLSELNTELYNEFIKRNNGLTASVLFEKQDANGYYLGHTKNYILVKVKSGSNIINKILPVKLTNACAPGVVLGEVFC